MADKKFRVRFDVAGGHVHCTVFLNGANCGNLVVRKGDEFTSFLRAFSGADFYGLKETIGIAEASTP